MEELREGDLNRVRERSARPAGQMERERGEEGERLHSVEEV